MNGLEALDKLCQLACNDRDSLYYLQHKNCKEADENIEFKPYCNGCPYCSGNELRKTIEKYLKALNIILEKKVDIYEDISESENFDEYVDNFNYQQECCGNWSGKTLLAQDEFHLLEEMLNFIGKVKTDKKYLNKKESMDFRLKAFQLAQALCKTLQNAQAAVEEDDKKK